MLKRDLMYMEDRYMHKIHKIQKDQFFKKKLRLGNVLLQQMHQKVPDSGTWGVSTAPPNQVFAHLTCW